jgi:hypothetical protein
MGVQLIHVGKKDGVVAIARNADPGDIEELGENGEVEGAEVNPGEATVTESERAAAPESE